MKRAIVNLVTNNSWFPRGQKRLIDSLKDNFDGDIIPFVGEEKVGSPKHSENPYAFKVYAIDYARRMGYRQILWLDASVWAVKDIKDVWGYIDEHGYMMQEDGNMVGRWANDKCLEWFELSKEEADKMVMFSAGFLGLDFENKLVNEFFAKWKDACDNGIFKGEWKNHRHDMTCASIIANRLKMRYTPGGTFMAYIGSAYGKPKDTACFYIQGMT